MQLLNSIQQRCQLMCRGDDIAIAIGDASAQHDPRLSCCSPPALLLRSTVTPPGYKTSNGNTTKCGANEYRADWKPLNQATNCLSCGSGVYAVQTDRLKVYDINNPELVTYEAITSSSDDCCEYLKTLALTAHMVSGRALSAALASRPCIMLERLRVLKP